MKRVVSSFLVVILALLLVLPVWTTPVQASTSQIESSLDFVDVPEIEIGKKYTAAYNNDKTSIKLTMKEWFSRSNSYVKFTVPQKQEYKLSVKESVGANYDVSFAILDKDYNEIKYYSLNKSSETDTFTLSKGTYYIKFSHYDKSYFEFKLSIPETAVALNRTKAELSVGDTTTLKLKNASDVTWVSGKKSVATVSSKGKVTAKKKGTAVIFAISDNNVYQCKINVTD